LGFEMLEPGAAGCSVHRLTQAVQRARLAAAPAADAAPDWPARSRAHVSSTPEASGETNPIPVTTTRRMRALPFSCQPLCRTVAAQGASRKDGSKLRQIVPGRDHWRPTRSGTASRGR